MAAAFRCNSMKTIVSNFFVLALALLGGGEAVAQGAKSQAWMKFQNLTIQDTIATTGVDSLSYRVEKAFTGAIVQVIVDRIGATALAGTVAFWGSTDKGKTWAVINLPGTTTAQSYTVTNSVSQSTFFYATPMVFTNLRVIVTGSGSGSAKYKALLTVGSGG